MVLLWAAAILLCETLTSPSDKQSVFYSSNSWNRYKSLGQQLHIVHLEMDTYEQFLSWMLPK